MKRLSHSLYSAIISRAAALPRPDSTRPARQRVEIALQVDDIDAIYHQARQAHADIARHIANYPWHIRQFWLRYSDGYLIRSEERAG